MGEGIGVASNSKGHIFVNTCAQQTRNFEFDPNGNYVREIGKDLLRPRLLPWRARRCPGQHLGDRRGRQLIIKFNPAGPRDDGPGPPAGVSHERAWCPPVKELDPAPPYIFNRPTDVAFDAAGNIFVADGYVNSRVIKYDKNGRFIKQAGTSRIGARPVDAAACHRRGCLRAMSTWAAAATSASWCSTTT